MGKNESYIALNIKISKYFVTKYLLEKNTVQRCELLLLSWKIGLTHTTIMKH